MKKESCNLTFHVPWSKSKSESVPYIDCHKVGFKLFFFEFWHQGKKHLVSRPQKVESPFNLTTEQNVI